MTGYGASRASSNPVHNGPSRDLATDASDPARRIIPSHSHERRPVFDFQRRKATLAALKNVGSTGILGNE
jgi:hypothetical protein